MFKYLLLLDQNWYNTSSKHYVTDLSICGTNLAWSKQKSIGWNKLSLNVLAQLKEKRLFKMAKDPSRQRENQSLGQTVLHVIIILQAHVQCRALRSHFTTLIITSCMNYQDSIISTLTSLFFCGFFFYDCLGTLQTVVILVSCKVSTVYSLRTLPNILERLGGVGWLGGMGRGGFPTPYDLDKHIRNKEDSGQSNKSVLCF